MKLVPCQFDLPLADNDGNPFPPEIFLEIKRYLDQQFGGWKIIGCAEGDEGSWLGQVERSLTVEVRVVKKEVAKLKKVVKEIGRTLGQKAIDFYDGRYIERFDLTKDEDKRGKK